MIEPKLRFKREDGASYPDWNSRSFSDTFSPLNNNTFSRDMLSENGVVCNIHYGDILVKFGEVCDIQTEDVPKVKEDIDTSKFDELQDGDIILADTAEDKTVGKAIEIYLVGTYRVVSGLHTMACRPNEKYAPKYLGYYINSPTYHNQLIPFMQGIKVTSIGRKNIADTVIYYPVDREEQQKIADLLSAVDEVIAQSEVEVQNLEQQKKAVMQKIFSQEVRFRREDGTEYSDWVETTFGTYYKIISGNAFKMNDYVENGVPLINGESIQHGYINDNNMNYLPLHFLADYSSCMLNEGDIVLGLNRPITNGQLKIAIIPSIFNNSLLYQRAGKIVFKEPIDKYFTYVFLNKQILDFTLKEAVGSDQPFISTTKLEKWKMIMPSDKQEIKQIGTFFKEVDEVITYAKQELDKWKELKKGLLQQMFV